MRKLFLPLALLSVLIAAAMLAERANSSANGANPNASENTKALSTPIINVRRIPEWLRRPTTEQEFAAALMGGLPELSSEDSYCLRVNRDGNEIVADNAQVGLVPAELQRLVTLAAVESFPRETVFVTRVVASTASAINNGVLEGNIYLVGGGDPGLSTNDYLNRFDDDRASTNFETLATELSMALRGLGASAISGGVVGDEFRFSPTENDYVGTAWTRTDNADNVVGPLSGLLVNDGFIWDNSTQTVTRSVDPAINAAQILTDLLNLRGIIVSGEPSSGEQPPSFEQQVLARIESAPLPDIAARAMIDGTTAEMLFKEIGRINGLSAASQDAAIGMRVALLERGLPTVGSRARDGSGLSGDNLATCELLMAVVAQSPSGGLVRSSLAEISESPLADCAPVGGADFRIVSADRGLITGIVGEMLASNGSVVSFALLANLADLGISDLTLEPCNELQTNLLEALGRYPEQYGPSRESISPLPVS